MDSMLSMHACNYFYFLFYFPFQLKSLPRYYRGANNETL